MLGQSSLLLSLFGQEEVTRNMFLRIGTVRNSPSREKDVLLQCAHAVSINKNSLSP
jgi:type VI protein secretion system component VasF